MSSLCLPTSIAALTALIPALPVADRAVTLPCSLIRARLGAAPPTVRALLRAIGRIASGSHAASSGPGILELARPISFLLMACDPNIQEIPKAVPGRAKKIWILRAAATRENDRTNLRMNSLVTIFRNYQLVFAFCSGTMRHRTRAGFCMLISADRCRDL